MSANSTYIDWYVVSSKLSQEVMAHRKNDVETDIEQEDKMNKTC